MKAQTAQVTLQGFARLPVLRQLGLLIGIAASIALGGAVVLWSQTPNYQLLFSSLSNKDVGEVMEALQKSNIPYKLDEGSGALMVPAGKIHDARLKLANQGLPKGPGLGFELMDKEPGFGTSQFMEAARYQRALEGELARSIGAVGNVQSARVHLAIPKQSVFVRNREAATASVLVNLYPGRGLDEGQVAGIVHLVASSIPNLEAGRVTVVDQKGHLLTGNRSTRESALSADQFDYTRRIEEAHIKHIEEILTPIVGRVRAQVVADVDFTVTEKTQESYDPQKTTLRSQQTAEEQSSGALGALGVPGALSNQPPPPASVPEKTAVAAKPAGTETPAASPAASATEVSSAANKSRRATQNFELDKTISHTRLATGNVRRLSVAVVIDERQKTNDKGEVERTPLAEDELKRITALVREAVGFDEKRGDTISVISAAFAQPEQIEALPEPPLWKQPWVWDVVKQVAGGVVVLFLVFGVLRPMLASLASKGREAGPGGGRLAAEQLSLGGSSAPQLAPAAPPNYENDLNVTKSMVAQDPKRVAQVVKTWVASDA